MKELLDTDRLNFLVWRYLLESNYRETAAKLQKEWRVHAPHRNFDFAPHVNSYALVTLLNKGLVLEDYQRQLAAQAQQHQQHQQQQVPHEVPPMGVFGPLKFEPDHEGEDDDEEDDSEPEMEEQQQHHQHSHQLPHQIENARKRPVDRQHPNGSPAKRQRLSNGYENGADSATTLMEIDHADNNNSNHAYPSPLEGEQAVTPLPRTEGPEQGTQVDKVHDLTQETVFLRLSAGDASAEGAEPSPAIARQNPLVLYCEWNPRDPSILAAVGTDALARVWTVSRGAALNIAHSGHVNGTAHPFRNLLDDDVDARTSVTTMAWNTTGDALALATDSENKARVCIVGLDGTTLHRFDGVEPPVVKLRWSPNNDYILGISSEQKGTLVTVFSFSTAESRSHFVPEDLLTDAVDATWISDTEFIICGSDALVSLRCAESDIVPGREFKTSLNEAFSQVQFDPHTKLIATASDKGTIAIWDESGQRRTLFAHTESIHALQWQPLQTEPADDERLLASGGEDGVICIWNVRSPENKPKYTMTMGPPVVGLSITPDGAFLAGATSDKILIWKIGENTIPRASWVRAPNSPWQSPREMEEELLPCLGWDSEGQKLVYGTNSRLAVINFR